MEASTEEKRRYTNDVANMIVEHLLLDEEINEESERLLDSLLERILKFKYPSSDWKIISALTPTPTITEDILVEIDVFEKISIPVEKITLNIEVTKQGAKWTKWN